jgi:hypothetical protein
MQTIIPGIARNNNQPTDRLTNRCHQPPNFDKHPVVGIDTIRVRGHHRGHVLTQKTERTSVDRSTGEIKVIGSQSHELISVLGHKVALQADDVQGGGVSFELSVPKILRRTNEVPASIQEVMEVVKEIYYVAHFYVDWTTDCDDLELHRVDLVRGFDHVTDISATLHRLSVAQAARGRLRKVFTDPTRGNAQTLTVGTPRRWMSTAYDKPTEMFWAASRTRDKVLAFDLREKARMLQARGHLRAEMSVRAKPLIERLGSNRLVDILKEETMSTTAHHYFEAAGLDTPVGGTEKIVQAVRDMSRDPDDRGVADRVIAMLFRDANGIAQTASRNSLDLYQQVARRHHLTAADFYQTDQPTMHLDWDRGIQVSGKAV